MRRIPDSELEFEFSRSGGPGGQNVNRVETRVTLKFDVAASETLAEFEKRRVRDALQTRINKNGVLRVTSQRHRTREANRRAAIERFEELIEVALKPQRPRVKTRVSKGAKRRRLDQKRRRSQIKQGRGKVSDGD